MGIGRFSLTPILPLMQHDVGLTFAQGGWLATSNYLGYLVGALICIGFAPQPAHAIRWGLVWVAIPTVAMGLGRSTLLWNALRFSAGVASAFVLVGVSGWAMPILAGHNKECDEQQEERVSGRPARRGHQTRGQQVAARHAAAPGERSQATCLI